MTVPDKDGWYIRRSDEMHLENLPIVDLQVTNDLFPGVVFNGTVDTIVKELLALNPEAIVNSTEPIIDKRSLEKRSVSCGPPVYRSHLLDCRLMNPVQLWLGRAHC